MIKWLLVLGVVWAVYYFFIKQKSVSQKTQTKKEQTDAQEMIECAKCGVYVELEEAILSNGKYYCSKECIKG
ncbi:MAG: hypothetical protein GXO11_00855 [Epsilonproteobacteria bacterium]|nr:hypothetical protein [Campylobacterota bacterium]